MDKASTLFKMAPGTKEAGTRAANQGRGLFIKVMIRSQESGTVGSCFQMSTDKLGFMFVMILQLCIYLSIVYI